MALILLDVLLAACSAGLTDFDRGLAAYQAKQFAVARPLLEKTAQAGNTDAMAIAGSMLVMGQGGSQDAVQGVRWLHQARRW